MVCWCDSGNDQWVIDTKGEKKDFREMCCQAQTLAHKLGLILEAEKIAVPSYIKNMLEQHRNILQNHKEEELDKDIKQAENNLYKIESRIKQINGLGGTPSPHTVQQLNDAATSLSELKAQRSKGRELLGGV